MKNENLIKRAIQWAKRKGFKAIRANSEEYQTPTNFRRPGEEDPIIPDVTGLRMNRKSYIELAVKTGNLARKVSKWELLSRLASRQGGKLFLLAPKGHKSFTEEIVKKYQLRADVIYLR